MLKPGDFDWDGDFRRRRPLVSQRRHLRGAVGDDARAHHRGHGGGARARRGRVVRSQLPREALERDGRRRPRAHAARAHTSLVDVLVGNEEDLQKGLGIEGPEIAGSSKLDPTAFLGMIDRVVAAYPRIKVVATTLRDVHSTNRHRWGAVAWINGQSYLSPMCDLDVHDRVGGGDGFAAGMFYGLLTGGPPRNRCASAGRTARSSRRFRATRRWRRSTRWRRSRGAARRGFSDRTGLVARDESA